MHGLKAANFIRNKGQSQDIGVGDGDRGGRGVGVGGRGWVMGTGE